MALVAAGSVVDWQLWHRPQPVFRDYPIYVHAHPSQSAVPVPPDFEATITADLAAGRYAGLDRMAADFRRPDAIFTAAVPKLYLFYETLGNRPVKAGCGDRQNRTDLDSRRDQLQAWRAAMPESITPRIALARLWVRQAWDARGCDYASAVGDDQWRQVNERLAEAEALLIGDTLEDDPATLYTVIEIGNIRGYGHARLANLYRRAVKRFPWYMPYYSQHANFIQTKWGGYPGELEYFLGDMQRPERGVAGQIAFTWAAHRLLTQLSKQEFIAIKALDFPALLHAYQVRETEYGLRAVDWNAIFLLSIWGLDCESSHTALLQIGDQWDPNLWHDRAEFERFVAWFHAHSKYK